MQLPTQTLSIQIGFSAGQSAELSHSLATQEWLLHAWPGPHGLSSSRSISAHCASVAQQTFSLAFVQAAIQTIATIKSMRMNHLFARIPPGLREQQVSNAAKRNRQLPHYSRRSRHG